MNFNSSNKGERTCNVYNDRRRRYRARLHAGRHGAGARAVQGRCQDRRHHEDRAGQGEYDRARTARAKVIAIDAKERVLTLKAANGKEVQIPAGPEVKNFDQIKVGDEVVARYHRSLSLSSRKTGKHCPAHRL